MLQRYVDNLNFLEDKLNKGRTVGMWRTVGYYLSDSDLTASKLGNLLSSIYNGDDSKPEKIRTVPLKHISSLVPSFKMPADELPEPMLQRHPIGKWEIQTRNGRRPIDYFKYLYQTIMPTDDLATFCQIPRKEMPGFYIDPYVEFDVAERRNISRAE